VDFLETIELRKIQISMKLSKIGKILEKIDGTLDILITRRFT
jgi:hypothetical protein